MWRHGWLGRGEVRRPQPEPDHQLSVLLRSDAGAAGQHGAYLLYAVVRVAGIAQAAIWMHQRPGCGSGPRRGSGAGAVEVDAVIAEVEEGLLPNALQLSVRAQPGVQPLLRSGAGAEGRQDALVPTGYAV